MSNSGRPTGSARAVAAYAAFDWSNSAFPAVVHTFVFATYFSKAIAPSPELGASYWAWMTGLSAFLIALLSPAMGAIADQRERRKPWLFWLTLVTILASFGLWWSVPEESAALRTLILVGLGLVGMEIGQAFYNSMLGNVAPPERLGRVSGLAFGFGYFGGLAALGVALVLLVQPDPPLFGLDKATSEQIRAIGPLCGLWFALFAIPLFLWVPDGPAGGRRRRISTGAAVRTGLRELGQTLRALPAYPEILRLLLGRLLFMDGILTLYALAGIYAAQELGFSIEQVLIMGILVNVTAGAGSLVFGWIEDFLGAKRVIQISLVCIFMIGGAILVIESGTLFYVLVMGMGLFFGPVQSANRTLYTRLVPEHRRTQFFGLYAFSAKATAFLGPLAVGWLIFATGSQRIGMSAILVFLAAGFLAILPLDVARGIARAREES